MKIKQDYSLISDEWVNEQINKYKEMKNDFEDKESPLYYFCCGKIEMLETLKKELTLTKR